MFEVRGRLFNRDVTVVWDNGELTGDLYAVHYVRGMARILEGDRIGPVCGPYTHRDHLANALSAYFVVERALDRVDDVTGDVPEVPVTPGVVH